MAAVCSLALLLVSFAPWPHLARGVVLHSAAPTMALLVLGSLPIVPQPAWAVAGLIGVAALHLGAYLRFSAEWTVDLLARDVKRRPEVILWALPAGQLGLMLGPPLLLLSTLLHAPDGPWLAASAVLCSACAAVLAVWLRRHRARLPAASFGTSWGQRLVFWLWGTESMSASLAWAGLSALAAGRAEQAMPLCDSALAAGQAPEAYALRGILAATVGEADAVRQAFDRGTQRQQTGCSHSLLGDLAYWLEDWTAAEDHFRKALERPLEVPNQAPVRARLAEVLRQLGRFEEAEQLAPADVSVPDVLVTGVVGAVDAAGPISLPRWQDA